MITTTERSRHATATSRGSSRKKSANKFPSTSVQREPFIGCSFCVYEIGGVGISGRSPIVPRGILTATVHGPRALCAKHAKSGTWTRR